MATTGAPGEPQPAPAALEPRYPWPATSTRAIEPRDPTLTLGQRRIVRTLAATLYDRGDGVPPDRLDWVEVEADQLIAAGSLLPRLSVTLALFWIQIMPIVIIFRLRLFTSLSLADRQRYLERMERHRIPLFGLPIMALKIVIGSVYFEHPDALPLTGYDGTARKGPVPR